MGQMLEGIVHLLGDVVEDAVGDGLDKTMERIERRRVEEQDHLIRHFEAALVRQEERFREALTQQARSFAAAMERQAEVQAQNLRAVLQDVLQARSVDSGEPRASTKGSPEEAVQVPADSVAEDAAVGRDGGRVDAVVRPEDEVRVEVAEVSSDSRVGDVVQVSDESHHDELARVSGHGEAARISDHGRGDDAAATTLAGALAALHETLRLGLGEIRAAREQQCDLMMLVRDELRPLARAALTRMVAPALPPPPTVVAAQPLDERSSRVGAEVASVSGVHCSVAERSQLHVILADDERQADPRDRTRSIGSTRSHRAENLPLTPPIAVLLDPRAEGPGSFFPADTSCCAS